MEIVSDLARSKCFRPMSLPEMRGVHQIVEAVLNTHRLPVTNPKYREVHQNTREMARRVRQASA